MKRISLAIVCSAAVLISSCKNNENQNAEDRIEENTNQTQMGEDADLQADESKEIRVDIEARSGSNVSGEAIFVEENGEVTMTVNVSGLTEGQHAIHLHEKADCSSDDATSAGGHWNPTFEDHGQWGDEAGYHRGDIGNFEVDSEGNGSITFSTDQWCIDCDDEKKNIVGKSVMIHDGVDDFTSQPAGNAGTRVGCGEIES